MGPMFPVSCTNPVDAESHPSDFDWQEDSPLLDVDDQGRILVLPSREPAGLELTECGRACKCGGGCGLGFSGASVKRRPAVHLAKSAGKGWGVVADEDLPAGALVCEYSGEYITNPEAQHRLQQYDAAGEGHALLVLREWLPSGTAAMRLNIDATRKGNLGRFFNHSCDGGNLRLMLARHTGSLLPRVLFVTKHAVRQGDELTYSYGPPNAGPLGKPCGCGMPACLGYMPHEEV